MKTYRDFSPTQFDSKGLGLPDRQNWLVAPVMRTRDSGALDESNFSAALKSLGGESETVEVHRFGHWGPGWFEIIICDPTVHAKTLEEMEAALSDYPVLDDEDFSERENEIANEAWENMDTRERIELCKRYRVSILRARAKTAWDASDAIYDHLRGDY